MDQTIFSEFGHAAIVIREKNLKLRIVIDYRALNYRIIRDSYTLLRVENILDCFMGCTRQ